MKKLILLSIFMLISCNKNDTFDSDKLIGGYDVKLEQWISEEFNSNKDESAVGSAAYLLANIAMSTVKMELNFYENQKATVYVNGGIVNAFVDESIDTMAEFSYKVKNDSIIYTKEKEENDFKKWAIIKKYDKQYNHFKLLIVDEDTVYFNLNKKHGH